MEFASDARESRIVFCTVVCNGLNMDLPPSSKFDVFIIAGRKTNRRDGYVQYLLCTGPKSWRRVWLPFCVLSGESFWFDRWIPEAERMTRPNDNRILISSGIPPYFIFFSSYLGQRFQAIKKFTENVGDARADSEEGTCWAAVGLRSGVATCALSPLTCLTRQPSLREKQRSVNLNSRWPSISHHSTAVHYSWNLEVTISYVEFLKVYSCSDSLL